MKFEIVDDIFICKVDTSKEKESILENIKKIFFKFKKKLNLPTGADIIYRYYYNDEKIVSTIQRFKNILLKNISAVDLIADKSLRDNKFCISKTKSYNFIVKMFEITHENIKNSNITFQFPRYREDEGKIVFFAEHDLFLLDEKSSYVWKMLIKNYTIKQILKEMMNKYPDVDKSVIEHEILKFISDMIVKNCIVVNFGRE